jgi:hypothetical protein
LEISGSLSSLGSIELPASTYGTTPGRMFITATGTLLTGGAVTGSGDLSNAGVIVGDQVSLDTIALATLTNDGTIVSGEDMKLTGAITAEAGVSGQIEISVAGILALNGAVSAGGTLIFGTEAGRLVRGASARRSFQPTVGSCWTMRSIPFRVVSRAVV